MTSVDTIRGWLTRPQAAQSSHMIVVCDTYDWSDYPVYIKPTEDIDQRIAQIHGVGMRSIMEVYDLKLGIEFQLKEKRAMHASPKTTPTIDLTMAQSGIGAPASTNSHPMQTRSKTRQG